VISPFIIRNYYLSGYLLYPFPGIDIFNVDWKIPLDNVISMKSEIESWAKIPTIPYPEVLKMKIPEWILPWFKLLNFSDKIMVTVNLFSIISLITMLFKKDFFLAKIQLIILINLIFWFIMAPDPRFAYGFIFLGFSLTLAYLVKLIEYSNYSGLLKYLKIGLAGFLIIIFCRRINFPVDTIKNPSFLIISAQFEAAKTTNYNSGFNYRVPLPGSLCFNAEIPCVPYPLANVVLRGDDFQHGFKVIKATH
jgi:hypothetical protein